MDPTNRQLLEQLALDIAERKSAIETTKEVRTLRKRTKYLGIAFTAASFLALAGAIQIQSMDSQGYQEVKYYFQPQPCPDGITSQIGNTPICIGV